MNLRRALFIAAFLLPCGAAAAQFQMPQPQQEPPCFKEFAKLRDDTQHKGEAIQAASKHKATPQEACRLFNVFTAAEAKMVKYAAENASWCGIPPQVVQQLKQGHSKAMEMRGKICQIAAAPPRQAGPTLSDALGGSIPDASNVKTGHGTFDTLTGSPLGSK